MWFRDFVYKSGDWVHQTSLAAKENIESNNWQLQLPAGQPSSNSLVLGSCGLIEPGVPPKIWRAYHQLHEKSCRKVGAHPPLTQDQSQGSSETRAGDAWELHGMPLPQASQGRALETGIWCAPNWWRWIETYRNPRNIQLIQLQIVRHWLVVPGMLNHIYLLIFVPWARWSPRAPLTQWQDRHYDEGAEMEKDTGSSCWSRRGKWWIVWQQMEVSLAKKEEQQPMIDA